MLATDIYYEFVLFENKLFDLKNGPNLFYSLYFKDYKFRGTCTTLDPFTTLGPKELALKALSGIFA